MLNATAQRDTGRQLRSYELGLQHGFIFAHSEAVQNTKGANPSGLELAMSWQRTDSSAWNLCNCYPRKGILLAYYNYDNAILGHNVTAAWFLEPVYRLGKNLFFSLRAAVGGSYLSNPFDSIRNPTNMSYSTRLSGYLLVGTGLWIRLSDQWWINPGINYQHVSNGGSREPNKGINWPTAGVSLSYRRQQSLFYRGNNNDRAAPIQKGLRYDLGVFGNARRALDKQGNSSRAALIGAGFQLSRQVGRIHNLFVSAEAYYDGATERNLERDSIQASAIKAQIAIGHEFVLGRFLFSQRIGTYLFDQTPYNDILFHRWGLLYRFSENWSAGFNLQAHRQVAEFVDLRLVYSWHKQKQE